MDVTRTQHGNLPVHGAATFGQRCIAFAFDYLFIAGWLTLIVALGALLQLLAPAAAAAVFGAAHTGQLAGFVLVTLPVTLYFAVQEGSSRQATWGKRRCGLRVQTVAAEAPGFVRALARTALKFVPWELAHAAIWQFSTRPQDAPLWATVVLALSWLLVGVNLASLLFSASRQTLYDRLSGTVVVRAP